MTDRPLAKTSARTRRSDSSAALVLGELMADPTRRIHGEGGGRITATLYALQLGSLMLPAAARVRYLEEWAAELRTPADQRSRRRFACQLMLGLAA